MSYQTPYVLRQRFLRFDERWEAREQFGEILELMQTNQTKLELALESGSPNSASIKTLLLEIEAFKVWSWGQSDRDEYFFDKVVGFDLRTHLLTEANRSQ